MSSKLPKTAKPVSKKELSLQYYIALIAVGSVLCVLAAGYFGTKLVQENIRNGKVIIGKNQAQSDLVKKISNAKTLVENYNQLTSQERQLISSALPDNPDLPQLISLLENVGVKSSTQIKSIAPTNAGSTTATTSSAPNGSQIYSLDVDTEGSYRSLTQLFTNLELSARPFNVAAFELKGTAEALRGQITVETYYQGPADISDKQEVVK